MAKDLFPSPHPLTPTHEEDDCLNWLRLLRSRRVGPATFFRLMTEHGNASAALAAAAGVKGYSACPEAAAVAELKAGKLAGASLMARGSASYPNALRELPDAPPLL